MEVDTKCKLKQLERLRSKDTPAAPWLPVLLIHIRPQVKTRQNQSHKFKKFAKTSKFENNITRDAPSEVAW